MSIMGAMYMLAAGSAGDSRQEILDALTGTDDVDAKSAFQDYFKMRQFLTHDSNKYTLQIGTHP